MTTLASTLASAIAADKRCKASGSQFAWDDRISQLADCLPSGSGVDNGTTIEFDECTDDKLVLSCGFHHMNDGGMYDGWTEHKIVVTPSFNGLNIKISGRDRNNIKEYLGDLFYSCLIEPAPEYVATI